MLHTSKFYPLLDRNVWVEKKEREKNQTSRWEHIYKSSFQNCGGKLLTRSKVFLNLVSLSRKRLCKGLTIQYIENNVIIINKSPVIVYR